MSRDKRYQKLLNSKRWSEVKRIVWQRAGGLCERCRREGLIRAGVDCHHKVPVESANPDDPKAMERLAYDVGNIELLCIPCHIRAHQELRSHYAETVKERKELKRRGFLQRNDPNYKPSNNNEQWEDHTNQEIANGSTPARTESTMLTEHSK